VCARVGVRVFVCVCLFAVCSAVHVVKVWVSNVDVTVLGQTSKTLNCSDYRPETPKRKFI